MDWRYEDNPRDLLDDRQWLQNTLTKWGLALPSPWSPTRVDALKKAREDMQPDRLIEVYFDSFPVDLHNASHGGSGLTVLMLIGIPLDELWLKITDLSGS